MNHGLSARAVALGTLGALVLAGAYATPAGAAPRCLGREATIVGGPGNNEIVGTPGPDVIYAGGGNDAVAGRGGNDRICGVGGKDQLFGMNGDDRIDGGRGNDYLAGMFERDRIIGGLGDDIIYGGDGGDSLFGAGGSDTLLGNERNDFLDGGGGRDYLYGLEGHDGLDGGPGFDLASYRFARKKITANLATGRASGEGDDRLSSIEDLTGSNQDDTLTGNGAQNFFFPRRGDDVVDGGGNLTDFVGFPEANGPVIADLTTQTATGEGTDTLASIEGLGGSANDDTLTANHLANYLFGGDGNDDLFGLEGDDRLDGWNGASDDGDGGPGEDFCVNIENELNCEQQQAARLALSSSVSSVAGPRISGRGIGSAAKFFSA